MRSIYHPPQVDIISKIYHPFRQGTDIIEKNSLRKSQGVFSVSRVRKRTGEKPLILLGFPRFSLRIHYNIKSTLCNTKMQKVPLKFITAMQSKRLQNCNRHKTIYSIHITLLSLANSQFTQNCVV